MIRINDAIAIDEKDLSYQFSRSGGPGGQNVNKVETSVEIRFDLNTECTLPQEVKERLVKLAGKRINQENILILTASEYRYQERNRELVLQKLIDLILKATFKPKPRRKTKPTKSSQEKRLTGKKKDSAKKSDRGKSFDRE